MPHIWVVVSQNGNKKFTMICQSMMWPLSAKLSNFPILTDFGHEPYRPLAHLIFQKGTDIGSTNDDDRNVRTQLNICRMNWWKKKFTMIIIE